jgi:nitrate/nitrite-specific signal transduction histidine kinase
MRFLAIRHSLLAKSLIAVLLPVGLVLAIVGFLGIVAADRIARQVVTQRDAELARVSADRLNERLQELLDPLERASSTTSLIFAETEQAETILAGVRSRSLSEFDVGLLLYDAEGRVRASDPDWLVRLPQWLEYPDRFQLRDVRDEGRSAFSTVFKDPITGVDFILATVPIVDGAGEVRAILAGAVSLNAPAIRAIGDLQIGDTGSAYLVDEAGNVIFHRVAEIRGDQLTQLEAVKRAIGGSSGAVIATGTDGERNVSGFAPVGNTGWGVITEERWDSIVGPVNDAGRIALLAVAAGGLLAAALLFFVIRRLLDPLRRLAEGAERISAGEFSHHVDTDVDVELRGLAERFNAMADALNESYATLERRVQERTAENTRLYEEAAERARELAELNQRALAVAGVAQEVGTLTRLDTLLPAVSTLLRETFGFTSVEVFLLDLATDQLVAGENPERFDPIALGEGPIGQAAEEGRAIVVDNLAPSVPSERGAARSEIAVPIRVGDLVVGVLDLRSPDVAAFSEADRFTVETFADQLAVAIENARLFEQTSDLAILEERNRFAREIHDTLAQGLTGIVLQLEALEQNIELDPQGALDHLDRARSLARESLQDARRSVWNLLPDRLVQNSLDEALQQEISRFDADGPESGRLVVTGRPRALRRDVQTALLRVGQEAMTNARKHAAAANVEVEVAYLPGLVRLRVTDDGRGIDANGTRSSDGGGFGLGGMRQRVQQLFGTFDVRRAGDEGGTVVEATIPAD